MATETFPTYHIKPPWLLFVRIAWGILFVVTIVVFIASLMGLYMTLSQPCGTLLVEDQKECFALNQAALEFGLPQKFFAIYQPMGLIVQVLPAILIGLLLFWKKSDEPFGLFFSLLLITVEAFGLGERTTYFALLVYPFPQWLLQGMSLIASGSLFLLYRFPDGYFVPRWLRWAAVSWVILQIGANLFHNSLLDFFTWRSPIPQVILTLFSASIIYSLAYRYRHTSNPIQIQQIKWVALSTSIVGVLFIYKIPFLPLVNSGIIPNSYNIYIQYSLFFDFLWHLGHLLIAASIGFSILRYRLWDIDFIINRSLVYGALTVLLAMVFGSSLFLVSRFAEGQSLTVSFGTTALIAGLLFNPVRRRIQRFVDRRFYDIKIDYQKTLPFSGSESVTQGSPRSDFGEYKNLELIGDGGMAQVYRSQHPTLGMPVAIKILSEHLVGEFEFRKRFSREVQIISKLEHPNIVRIFDSGEKSGKQYMVMEYLDGRDLSKFIRSNGRLSLSQTLSLVHQIATALDYAHVQGLVHRDIKPSNILLDTTSKDGIRAVLTDFGIAKILHANTVLTHTGGMLGTFDYIAPEQIQAATDIDGKADIYALGVMVYQMLTGELPFKHQNIGALLIAHLNQPPPDPREILSDLPHHIARAVQQAMAKQPNQRFASATEFVMEIS